VGKDKEIGRGLLCGITASLRSRFSFGGAIDFVGLALFTLVIVDANRLVGTGADAAVL
jgi:hypothetical protein